MKPSLYFVVSLGLALLLSSAWGQQSSKIETAFVYKPDGTLHCDTNRGISLEAMAQELIRNDISIVTRRKAHDGREGIAVCGKPTGSINVYEIAKPDLSQALQLGFQRLDSSLGK